MIFSKEMDILSLGITSVTSEYCCNEITKLSNVKMYKTVIFPHDRSYHFGRTLSSSRRVVPAYPSATNSTVMSPKAVAEKNLADQENQTPTCEG